MGVQHRCSKEETELRLRAGTMVSTVAVEGRCSLGGNLGTDQWGPSLGQEAREAGNPGGREEWRGGKGWPLGWEDVKKSLEAKVRNAAQRKGQKVSVMYRAGWGQSQSVKVKAMDTPAGEGCQGKEASGEVGVLNVNLGSYSLNKTIDVEKYIQRYTI